MSNDSPDADDYSIAADEEAELREVIASLRELQHKRESDAAESTTAQSRKYNQGAAYAYAISANTVEGVLDGDD